MQSCTPPVCSFGTRCYPSQRCADTRGADGEGKPALQSYTPPVRSFGTRCYPSRRCADTRGADGEGQSALRSYTSPVRPCGTRSRPSRWCAGGPDHRRGIKSFATCFMGRLARTTPLFRRRSGSRPCAARGDGVAVVGTRASGSTGAISNDGWCRTRVNMHTSAGGSSGSCRDAICGTASHTRGGGSGIESFATCFMCRPAPTTPLFRRRNGSLPCAACGDGVVVVSMRVSGDMCAVGN